MESSGIYTAHIKNTKWIDLSKEHLKLRENLETEIKLSCVEKKPTNPSKVDGAFRIGKSQLLYYLFHYAWGQLHVPALYLKLADIIEILKEYKGEQEDKIPKSEVTNILNEHFKTHIINLKEKIEAPNQECFFYFPDYMEKQNLKEYVERLGGASLYSIEGEHKDLENITIKEMIETLDNENRLLLLVDEFEESYYKINEIVESFGGGALRQFFEDVSKHKTIFHLIIGCGPASGYEFQQELLSSSQAAETGRIRNYHIPFPSINSLRDTFLKDLDRGYLNFIWWISRVRPGLIKKFSDELDYNDLSKWDYEEFIENSKQKFDMKIDELGEGDVPVIKYGYIHEKIEDTQDLNYVKNLLISLEPRPISVEGQIYSPA